MPTIVNHLKNRDAQSQLLEYPIGRHLVSGDLIYSYSTGTAPSHQIYTFNGFGEGPWEGLEGVWVTGGDSIAPADYHFHAGGQAAAMAETDSWFPGDVPHSRTAGIACRFAVGFGEADTAKNTPNLIKAIAKTKLLRDFDNTGDQVDLSYSANPARAIASLLFDCGRLINVPSIYTDYLSYWRNRIDWGCWSEFKDYHDELETVDYRTIDGLLGFGLFAEYHNNTTLSNFFSSRIEPSMDLQLGLGTFGYGMNVDNISARFEGFIKFPYSETFTFTVTVDNGVKVWINNSLLINQWSDDGLHTPGVFTCTYNATAGAFVPIKIEYNEGGGGGPGYLKMEWESTSQPIQVIPSKCLYPKVRTQPRYETHLWFSGNSISDAINRILLDCNSIKQEVNGKLRFFCLEQLSSEWTFDETNIIDNTFRFSSDDILAVDPITEYEANFKDLESQFLESPQEPITYKLDWANNKSQENIKVINLGNMTRWQARKCLQMRAKLEMARGIKVEFESLMSKTWQPMPGTLATLDHRKFGDPRQFLVIEANDKRSNDKEPQRRIFKLQEF